MIVLVGSTQSLEVITAGAGSVRYQASWTDYASGVGTPGTSQGAITSITTTTVVAAPSGSTQRVIHHLVIYMQALNTITIQRDVSGTNYLLYPATSFAENSSVEYTLSAGFQTRDPNSAVRSPSGRLIRITRRQAGTSGTHTFFSNTRSVIFEMVAGGSGGCGCILTGPAVAAAGTGGAGGAYGKFRYPAVLQATCTYTVGSGGAGGAGQSGTPGDGGDTSVDCGGGSTAICTGGSISAFTGMTANSTNVRSPAQGTGGVPTAAGSITLVLGGNGSVGEVGERFSATETLGGQGGLSGHGSCGGDRRLNSSGNGDSNSNGHGGGGGGASNLASQAVRAGGLGQDGILVIYEYS